ncbi:MAG: lytic transglycosylase domain-containing protein [Phormidesmis sp.]
MLKTLKDKWPLVLIASSSALLIGMVVAFLKTTDAFTLNGATHSNIAAEQLPDAVRSSAVLGLSKQTPAARDQALSAIAQQNKGSEGDRARYLLAADLIGQGKGGSALPLLENLDTRYTALAPYILLKKGQAQAAASQTAAAQSTWTQLVANYSDSAAAGEALYRLGQLERPDNLKPANAQANVQKQNSSETAQYWDTLLTRFPNHPLSVEVALERLGKPATEPATTSAFDELALLKLVAYHGFNHPDYGQMLNRLTQKYSSSLTPADWEAVGFGYWETQNYAQAGDAYAKASGTPIGLYRAARGKETGGKAVEARALYQKLNQAFPQAPETAIGLLNLSDLLPPAAALTVLDQVVARFPDQAANALVKRADILAVMKSPASAQQARASVLSQYSESAAAAKIRLANAKASAKAKNYPAAIAWAQQLIAAAPDDDLAAEAGFWLGKWALLQNQPEVAQKAFEQVIRSHPEAYYAWRSAVHLNWAVGDFDTVRTFTPDIAIPPRRSPLPTGSATLQELYLLGQDQSAWEQWQTEFDNVRSPTVAEQFTDGILRLGVGDNLNGIFMVSSLRWRELPDDKKQYQLLKRNPNYWQAIYPFPFSEIIQGWAKTRQINPLLVTGLVRQESRFQPQIESVVGAVGLMQVMPETAEWIGEQTGTQSYSLTKPEDNVNFGTWFLNFTHEQFDNNSLFAVASYNAGPGSVDGWIKEGGFTNADDFVEKIPYPETKGYIDSVFGGYWNYLRLYNPEIAAKIKQL